MGIEQSISRIVNSGAQIGQAAAPLAAAAGHPEIAAGMSMAPMALQAMGMGQQQPPQPPPAPMQRPMPPPQQMQNMSMPQPLPPIAGQHSQLPPQVAQMLGLG